MEWRKDCVKGLLAEKEVIFPKEVGLLLFEALWPVCQFIRVSLAWMPKVVVLCLDKIQRDFLCGEGTLYKRPHLVKWKKVCTDKRQGGLGV